MEYKETLNLPQTDFPMKASLSQKEPEQLQKWADMGLYAKIEAATKNRPKFILHDGPPYANGHIHAGHALNKTLKDFIVRSRRMQGFYTPYVPGWDCHGLPIEHQVEKELGSKKAGMTRNQIRKLCRAYAEKFVNIQREEFKRLGIMGDWERPYITMDREYEAITAEECGKFALDGSLYHSKKPVYWCPSCQTALAEAEIEYADAASPSIFVRFPLRKDLGGKIPALAGKNVAVVIWTTTPWTIPANLGIALHPDYAYGAYDCGAAGVLIMAKALAADVLKQFGYENAPLVADVDSRLLENMNAGHPLYDRDSLIMLGTHVTLEAGTGCVHTAPGHGREDYDVGCRYGLDVYSPVDDRGCYTSEVPEWEREYVLKANPSVVAALEKRGAVLAKADISHSYPHCWRCKKPVIFRATPQWFISMDKTGMRENALREIDQKVRWIPTWGRDRIYNMIENRLDWCVSRQRAWGVPIIMFFCEKCSAVKFNAEIMAQIKTIFMEEGADAWYEYEAAKFLPPDTACDKCGHTAFQKETDILDVWFDSGVSHEAVLAQRDELSWPADMYLEGSDQHRGWFHSSLLTAVARRGAAPYRQVLTHGFLVDGEGRKMSKSVGNTVAPQKIIEKYGAEILRLWIAAADYREDIRVSEGILKQASDAYRRIRNTCRYMLGNMFDFNPDTDMVPYAELPELDRLALHRLQKLAQKAVKGYDDYEFHTVYHAIHNFCAVDLSAFYLDILKDRLYASAQTAKDRRAAQTVLFIHLDTMSRLMAPMLPFTTDEIWQYMPQFAGKEVSVHLMEFCEINADWLNDELAAKWDTLLEVRVAVARALETARTNKEIGHSLDALVKISANPKLYALLNDANVDLRSVLIVSQVELGLNAAAAADEFMDDLEISVSSIDSPKCQRCWIYDPTVGTVAAHGEICARCAAALDA